MPQSHRDPNFARNGHTSPRHDAQHASVGDTCSMDDDEDPQAAQSAPGQETEDGDVDREATLEAFDLDHDGKVSDTEAARANLGVIDAGLQARAERGGILGKLAGLAHRVLDRFDND